MNKTQAFKKLLEGKDVTLNMKMGYFESNFTFLAKHYGREDRKVYFSDTVKNEMRDFKDFIRTGSSNAKFTWVDGVIDGARN